MERVQKLLSQRGFCSRRKAEELIKEGRVKVNENIITIGDQATNKDKITVDDEPIDRERRIYLMLNKPQKCVTALTDDNLKTVMEYITINERVFPVGRLDYDTTGLLLLTNDGDFANRVMHPRNEVKKTYQVKLNGPISDDEIQELKHGIHLRDGKTCPAKIKKYDRKFLDITIHEGKNQIIKRMIRKLGLKVSSLKRVAIGRLTLGKLKPGEFKELNKKELDLIFIDILIPGSNTRPKPKQKVKKKN